MESMDDDFRPAPDNYMADSVAHLCRRAAQSWGRLDRLLSLPPSECVDWVARRERQLIRARDIALRLRAHEAAEFIERQWGRETIPGDLMDDGSRYCHAAYLWSILSGRTR